MSHSDFIRRCVICRGEREPSQEQLCKECEGKLVQSIIDSLENRFYDVEREE